MKWRFPFRVERVYILPTRFGAIYGGSLFLMLSLSYTYNNNLAYALTFFLVSLGFASLFFTQKFMQELRLEAPSEIEGQEGHRLFLPIRLQGLTQAHSQVEVRWPAQQKGLRFISSFSLPQEQHQLHRLELQAEARGLYPLQTVEVRSTYPLGLFRAWKRVSITTEAIVFPSPEGSLKPPQGDSAEEKSASAKRPLVGPEPEDFLELRPWREGDPLTRLDAKASARRDQDLVKDFESPEQNHWVFRWQDTQGLQDLDSRLRQLSAWLEFARKQNRQFRLELPGEKTAHHPRTARRLLATWSPPPEAP